MTYSRFATIEINPDKVEAFKRFHIDQILTGGRELPGFQGIQLLMNPKTGKGYSVTLWDNRDAARAALPSLTAMRDRGAKELDAMGFISDFVEGFELILAEDA